VAGQVAERKQIECGDTDILRGEQMSFKEDTNKLKEETLKLS